MTGSGGGDVGAPATVTFSYADSTVVPDEEACFCRFEAGDTTPYGA